jgi:hypothetical protein
VAETCNGADDNCDGQVDNGLGSSTCGVGACVRTVQNCIGGTPQTCNPGNSTAETCNNIDDNCNGATDDGLGSTTCGQGICQRTVQNCVSGAPQTCNPGTPAAVEDCNNNLDDNCNGLVNDGCVCTGTQTQACYTGPAGTQGVGICRAGTQTCNNGQWGTCLGQVGPGSEACNNQDDDCDNQTDENLGSTTCGQGACRRTVNNCVGGVPQTCSPGSPTAETCNGIDDNCNGTADDGLGSTTCGVGVCVRTVQNCSGGVTQTCTPGTPVNESCNGLDDNCNGTPDEGLGTTTCGIGACVRTVNNCSGGTPQTCNPGNPGTETCNNIDDDCDGTPDDNLGSTTCGVGICRRTVQNCVSGTPQTCTPLPSSTEVCNGLDDDCDGQTDEGLGSTTCGVGVCQRTVNNCIGGVTQTCAPGPAGTESCNGQDDNCNGQTDENLGSTTCGTGACRRTVNNCVGGVSQTCTPLAAGTESCNNIDDDCDGVVDDGLGSTTCGVGFCQRTQANCVNGSTVACTPGNPATEVCNNVDDNCNSQTDENLGSTSCGQGICLRTVQNCVNGATQTCSPGASQSETCNGLDDDCDGQTDETFPQQNQSCSTGLAGRCAAGTYICTTGLISCQQTNQPVAEICNNGIDDDCNGTTDIGPGCCNANTDNDFDGYSQCTDCNDRDGTIHPNAAEVCNGKDDDCDGIVDENFDVDQDCFTTCGTNPGCRSTACASTWGACSAGVNVSDRDCNDTNNFVYPRKTVDCGNAATPTTANNVDDNCNGYTDETCACSTSTDRDGDGSNQCVDCDDNASWNRPGGTEVCDGRDNDCNRSTVDNCGVSDPCGSRQGSSWVYFPSGTDKCRPDLICVSNLSTGALTCGSFCNQTGGAGLNDSCASGEGCYSNLVDSDNLKLCSVVPVGGSAAGATCSLATSCRSGDCETADGTTGYCTDKCTHEAGCTNNTTCHVNKTPLGFPQVQGYYYWSQCRLDTRVTATGFTLNTGDACSGANTCKGGTDMCVNGRCAEPCCNSGECANGYGCTLNGPRAATGYQNSSGEGIDSVVPACTQQTGTRVAGAACGANTDCRSGICDRNLNICIDICCNDSSCANGTTCEPINFRFSNGRVTFIRACVFSPLPTRIEQR